MKQSRDYVFTTNNYTEAHIQALEELDCVYVVYGKEKGDSGTPHLQGYVRFKSPKTFSACKKAMPEGSHIEIKKGTCQQAIDYCKKDGDVYERGEAPKSAAEGGKMEKQRWKRILAAAEQGDWDMLREEEPQVWCRMEEKLRKKRKVVPEPLPIGPGEKVHEWYYGVPGSGKSHKARMENPGAYIKRRNKWWDGYEDQDVVIIEEWSPDDKLSLQNLKEWADKWPFGAERKGGYMVIRPRKIIVCSNYHPNDCCERAEDSKALARRFKVTHFTDIFK